MPPKPGFHSALSAFCTAVVLSTALVLLMLSTAWGRCQCSSYLRRFKTSSLRASRPFTNSAGRSLHGVAEQQRLFSIDYSFSQS